MEPTSNPIPESAEPLQSSVPRLPAKNLSQPRECLPSLLSRPNVSAQGPVVQEAPMPEKWRAVFQVMDAMAPRVGNLQIDSSHDVFRQVQELLPQMDVQVVYVGRGMERCQVPLGLPNREQNTMRHTLSPPKYRKSS